MVQGLCTTGACALHCHQGDYYMHAIAEWMWAFFVFSIVTVNYCCRHIAITQSMYGLDLVE